LGTLEFLDALLLHDIGPLPKIVMVNKHKEASDEYLLGLLTIKMVIYFIARHPGKFMFLAMLH
jgi:hypothetical protein